MAIADKSCTIMPYFKVLGGDLDNFKKLCGHWIEETNKEPDCLYCGFSVNGDIVCCRETYKNADAVLNHLDNIGDLLFEALTIAQLSRLEIHGSEDELAKLRQPLANMHPQFFISLDIVSDDTKNKEQPERVIPILASA
jgi:hypothetical protein